MEQPDDSNFVAPALFARHLRMLVGLGYTGVTVADVVRWQRDESPLPARPIVLTFDDGYASTAGVIPAILSEGWSATIFVVTSNIDGWNAWDTACTPARMLSAASLREIARQGVEVASHTRSHRRVTTLTAAESHDELLRSRQELEVVVDRPVRTFSFPYGTHDRVALERVAAAGYTGAVTLKRWANRRDGNSFRIGRMSVGGPLPPWQLAAKLGKMLLTPARR